MSLFHLPKGVKTRLEKRSKGTFYGVVAMWREESICLVGELLAEGKRGSRNLKPHYDE